MDKEKPTETLLRPNLRVKPSQWSAAQRGSLASRSAIIATVIAILGGMGLVFVYPYFNIDRFRKRSLRKSNKRIIKFIDN
jgi:hypothetical protein